jgi:SAM-dependent methyltransferase
LATSWREFWDRDTPIYVSARHKTLHYARIAADIRGLIADPDAVVLDQGCGEALFADRVAAACHRLHLCDAAPLVRERLTARFGREPRIAVIAPDAVADLPDASLDLVVANSLAQYLTRDELRTALRLWCAKLKHTGTLVLADVVPPDVSPLADARALLAFGWQGGFLGAAVLGLARTAFSDYRRLRAALGLTRYSEAEALDLLRAEGFAPRRLPQNLGHNPARMAFSARPAR